MNPVSFEYYCIYDGDCGVCSFLCQKLKIYLGSRSCYFAPAFHAELEAYGIDLKTCQEYFVLIYQEKVFLGAEAMLKLLGARPFWRPLSVVLALWPCLPVLRLGYRVFARNRRRISSFLGLNACKIS